MAEQARTSRAYRFSTHVLENNIQANIASKGMLFGNALQLVKIYQPGEIVVLLLAMYLSTLFTQSQNLECLSYFKFKLLSIIAH